jgi:RNA polymerase sigma-70 factor (ECF subfamily)
MEDKRIENVHPVRSQSSFLSCAEGEIPHLRRAARILVNHKYLADEIVYEALRQALSAPKQWATRSSVRVRLLKWLWLEHGRRRANGGNGADRGNGAFVAERQTEASACGCDDDRHAVSSDIERSFQRLEEHERHVLLLVVISGMSYEETAFILDVSFGEVRKRLGSARNHLAALTANGNVDRAASPERLTQVTGM